jgi:hypothetical protein
LLQGNYNFIPGTNHVFWVCNVTAILQLQYLVHVMLQLFYSYNIWYMSCYSCSTVTIFGSYHVTAVFYSYRIWYMSCYSCFTVTIFGTCHVTAILLQYLVHVMLQLFHIYNIWYMSCYSYSTVTIFGTCHITAILQLQYLAHRVVK